MLLGQAQLGRIAGRVSDASGAAVPEAQIVIRNLATGTAREVTTSSIGEYVAASLQPGDWSVEIYRSGFETRTLTVARVFSGQTRRVDVELRTVGDRQEVSVAARVSEIDPVS